MDVVLFDRIYFNPTGKFSPINLSICTPYHMTLAPATKTLIFEKPTCCNWIMLAHPTTDVVGGRKSVKYPKGCDIDVNEFPADWFEGLSDEQVCIIVRCCYAFLSRTVSTSIPFLNDAQMNGQEGKSDVAYPMQYKGRRYNIQLNRYKVKSGKRILP